MKPNMVKIFINKSRNNTPVITLHVVSTTVCILHLQTSQRSYHVTTDRI